MSVRRRRFGRIKQAIKNGASGGYLDKYKAYINGTVTVTRTMPARQGTKKLALNPFGSLISSTPTKSIATCSGRAWAAIGGIGLSATDLGVDESLTNSVRNPGLMPAKAIIKKFTSASGTPDISKITGLNYSKRAGESYTLPFGKVGTGTEFDAAASIAEKVNASAAQTSITFQPERLYAS